MKITVTLLSNYMEQNRHELTSFGARYATLRSDVLKPPSHADGHHIDTNQSKLYSSLHVEISK